MGDNLRLFSFGNVGKGGTLVSGCFSIKCTVRIVCAMSF